MPKIEYEIKKFNSATMEIINQAESIIIDYQNQGFNLTLRQIYYQFVSQGLLPENTERQYKRIGNILSDARRAGLIDWNAIEDRTRFIRNEASVTTTEQVLEYAPFSIKHDLWHDQPRRIEVWIEKDALVGVITDICEVLEVPYFSCRGYVSDSEMWRAAMRQVNNYENGQETIILHLGDHDPSGIDMSRDIEDRIRLFTQGEFYINVKRIALTMDQILEVEPPPNPAKMTDTRYGKYISEYGDESWELDALEQDISLV